MSCMWQMVTRLARERNTTIGRVEKEMRRMPASVKKREQVKYTSFVDGLSRTFTRLIRGATTPPKARGKGTGSMSCRGLQDSVYLSR